MVRYLLRNDQGAKDFAVKDLGVDAHALIEDEAKPFGKTGLHLAAIHDCPEIALELIEKHCPIKVQNSDVSDCSIVQVLCALYQLYYAHFCTILPTSREIQPYTLPIKGAALMWLKF